MEKQLSKIEVSEPAKTVTTQVCLAMMSLIEIPT